MKSKLVKKKYTQKIIQSVLVNFSGIIGIYHIGSSSLACLWQNLCNDSLVECDQMSYFVYRMLRHSFTCIYKYLHVNCLWISIFVYKYVKPFLILELIHLFSHSPIASMQLEKYNQLQNGSTFFCFQINNQKNSSYTANVIVNDRFELA